MAFAKDIACYFLSKDTDKKVFTKNVISRNGRDFYEGNARLNKYLHMAQNAYIAKTGTKLFEDNMLAFDNGAVVREIQNNFAFLCNTRPGYCLTEEIKTFLDKIYAVFENATIDELIELSHEDSAWLEKQGNRYLENEIMDSMKYKEEYQEQYSDLLEIMENMG